VAGQGVATACPGWLRLATTPGRYGRARLAGVGQGVGFGLPWLPAAGRSGCKGKVCGFDDRKGKVCDSMLVTVTCGILCL
jgi:hypothetical protein